jgi:assimilatory nitrate reductase catalytic subunit
MISRQRAFLSPPGKSKVDWQIICDVAQRMGFPGFQFENATTIFREHAALSAFENNGTRAMDVGACANLSDQAYEALSPFQWPRPRNESSRQRMFADGKFFTENRRANLIATPHRVQASETSIAFPLVLNTGRIRDQWHTMTRTGKSARLMAHIGEPFVEIHPADAKAKGIVPVSLVRVSSDRGDVILRALVTDKQQQGAVFAPMHWNDSNASLARIDALMAPHVDPVSGQPELKFGPVEISPFPASWYGFSVTTRRPSKIGADYWAEARADHGFRLELASEKAPQNWTDFAEGLLQSSQLMAYVDEQAGTYRYATFENHVLAGAVFISREPVAVARNWLAEQLGMRQSQSEAMRILAGRSGSANDCGSIVCACNNVGKNSILSAIAAGAHTVNAVGDATKAGTSCGSCRAELQGMLHGKHLQAAE